MGADIFAFPLVPMSSRRFAKAWMMWRAAARDLDYILYCRINATESIAAARWYNGLKQTGGTACPT
jgi:hypothetical protein